jgi:hypothetical protein
VTNEGRKLCECGCGLPVPIATYTIRAKGIFKGEPTRFVNGHTSRIRQSRERDAAAAGPNPSGLCMCGCGQPAPISKYNRPDRDQWKGKPVLFIRGHVGRGNQYNVKHGHKRVDVETTEYRIWKGIVQRCTNPARPAWPNYGGRGIQVCDRWRTSFENFLADMGHRPPGLTIDRIDNDGHYEPGNCRWATWVEQRANRRDSRKVTA